MKATVESAKILEACQHTLTAIKRIREKHNQCLIYENRRRRRTKWLFGKWVGETDAQVRERLEAQGDYPSLALNDVHSKAMRIRTLATFAPKIQLSDSDCGALLSEGQHFSLEDDMDKRLAKHRANDLR